MNEKAEPLVCSHWSILLAERSPEWQRTHRVGSNGPKFKSYFCLLPAGWQDNCVNLEFLIGEFGIMVLIS